jgi:hypothetical protein
MKKLIIWICIAVLATAASADPRLWEDALAVRQGYHTRWAQASARNENSEVLMVWSDARAGNYDVYAQLISPAGVPQWTDGGVRVVAASREQLEPVVTAVTGGWIIAWQDYRRQENGELWGSWVRAQKLDMNGNPIWWQNDATGVLLDNRPSSIVGRGSLHIIHDGLGGALVCWSNSNIYVQRVGASGEVNWAGARTILAQDRYVYQMNAVDDGQNNLLITWADTRNQGNRTVFAAMITRDAEIPWTANGVPVGPTRLDQTIPRICADGANGCYISWLERLSSTVQLKAQRLNPLGLPQWAAEGVIVRDSIDASCSKQYQALSYNAATPDGVLLVWEDSRVNDIIPEIYAQKLSPQGLPQWALNGIKVNGDAGGNSGNPSGEYRESPRVLSDYAGGLVTVWRDGRNRTTQDWNNFDLYGGRVLLDGTLAWGEAGLPMAQGPHSQEAACLQLASGVMILFDDSRTGSQTLRVQQINLNGQRQLPEDGIPISGGPDENIRDIQSIAIGNGRVALVWIDARDGNYGRPYYQFVEASGQVELANQGTPLISRTDVNLPWSYSYKLCPDGNNGFFALLRLQSDFTRVFAVHVNSAGEVTTDPEGVEIPLPANSIDLNLISCTPDGAGGCYVAIERYNEEYVIDLFMQRIDATCHVVWTAPVQLSNDNTDDIVFDLVSHPDGGCTVVWRAGGFGQYDIKYARLDRQGNVLINAYLCNANGPQENARAISDGSGGLYAVWVDRRDNRNNMDLFAQHLNALGQELWTAGGMPIFVDDNNQGEIALSRDINNNLFVFWSDYRSEISNDIYAQKISPAGAMLWPPAGLPVCTAPSDQNEPQILSDGGTGVFAVWTDFRHANPYGKSYIYGTHLRGDGTPVDDPYWIADGNAITDTNGVAQQTPVLCDDRAGGFLVAWRSYVTLEEEFVYWDLYAQRIRNVASAAEETPAVAYRFELSQNFPNPFNPSTSITFSLPQTGQTKLTVYNVLGEEVARLTDRVMPAGKYRLTYNASALSSGIYFYRLESPAGTLTRRMLLLK